MFPQPFILSDRRLLLPIAWEAQYRGLAGVDCAATSESGCFTQASWLQPPTVHCCFGTLPWASNVHLSKAVGQTIDGLRSSPWLCSVVLGDSVLRDTALRRFGASHQRDSLLVSAAVPPIFAERNNPLSADSTAFIATPAFGCSARQSWKCHSPLHVVGGSVARLGTARPAEQQMQMGM